MQRIAGTLTILMCGLVANTAAFAVEETLQNDGYSNGAPVSFQAGFVPGEVAAARFVPTISCPCLVTKITLLFGGSAGTRDMGVSVWEDGAGADTPGALLFTGNVALTGSNSSLQEIDLSLSPLIVEGPFRVGLEFGHSGLPSVATDLDGTIDASANFILADLGGLLFWFPSATLGVTGDFVIRATIDNLVQTDTDSDSVPDDVDNCTLVANADQRDTDGDNFGNRCDSDLNNDCFVNIIDLGLLRTAFFSTPGSPNWNPDADFNGDDVVNVIDLGIMRSVFFEPPGPSGLPNACDP